MRTCKFFYLATMSLIMGCLSCSDDIENEIEPPRPEIQFQVVYKTASTGGKETPDIGSTAYVYYGMDQQYLIGFTYNGKGQYTKGDDIALPDTIIPVQDDGRFTVYPRLPEEKILIHVESHFYGRMSYIFYPYCREKMIEKIIFND